MEEGNQMSADEKSVTKEIGNMKRLVCGGLIGISLIIVQAFLSIGFANAAATITILAFAIAVPMLALYIMSDIEFGTIIAENTKLLSILYWAGASASATGIVAAFWYMSWIAGIVIICSGLAGVIVYVIAYNQKYELITSRKS
jgi:hypothetical protein